MGRCSKRATGQACKPSSFGRGKKLTRESACHGNHGEEDDLTEALLAQFLRGTHEYKGGVEVYDEAEVATLVERLRKVVA